MQKLTKRVIDTLTPTEKEQVVWDPELSGFGVRLKPSGRKTFVVQYRNSEGRSRRLTLGQYGRLTPVEARQLARQILAASDRGDDPAEDRQQQRQAATVRDLAARYLEQHARTKKKPSSVATDERLLRLYVLPAFGTRRAQAITLEEVSRFHYEMREKPIQANRVLALLSKMFNLAERWGMRPLNSNPCRHVERYKENRCERFLSAVELGRLGDAIARAELEQREIPSALLAIRLLILTGARRGEILGLKWEHVDLEKGSLRLPDSKTGRKVIPLGAPAVQLLVEASGQAGDTDDYVCPGYRGGRPISGLYRIWNRLREEAGLAGVRLHDLRHTHAAFAAGAGIGLPVIGRLLGHTQPATTQRYAHLADDPLREAAERVSAEIESLISKRA